MKWCPGRRAAHLPTHFLDRSVGLEEQPRWARSTRAHASSSWNETFSSVSLRCRPPRGEAERRSHGSQRGVLDACRARPAGRGAPASSRSPAPAARPARGRGAVSCPNPSHSRAAAGSTKNSSRKGAVATRGKPFAHGLDEPTPLCTMATSAHEVTEQRSVLTDAPGERAEEGGARPARYVGCRSKRARLCARGEAGGGITRRNSPGVVFAGPPPEDVPSDALEREELGATSGR